MSKTVSKTETRAFEAQKAQVDEAVITPLPNSQKIYVTGSRPDIRVPMRKISQSDTPTDMANGGSEKKPTHLSL